MKKNKITKNDNKNRIKRAILTTTVMIGMIVFLGTMAYQWYMDGIQPAYNGPVSFQIQPEESIPAIAQKLKELGLILEPQAFLLYLRLNKMDSLIHAGDYSVEKGIHTLDELMELLLLGQEKTFSYTIPEGWTIDQIAAMLVEKQLIPSPSEFIDLAKKNGGWFLFRFQEEVLASDTLEGYLYPETYLISKPSAKTIIEQLLLQYDSMIEDAMVSRAKELQMTWNEVMTLASIIEKESAGSAEMTTVSSVFHNRLRDQWPLQSCAALEYTVPREGYVFTHQELLTDTPYNTYLYQGLPPTPVCNPSIDAIRAALWPENTSYFFFVAKGDGTHAFSRTLEEHNKNVQHYIP